MKIQARRFFRGRDLGSRSPLGIRRGRNALGAPRTWERRIFAASPPSVYLGLVRVVVIWLAAWALFAHERDSLLREHERHASNLALVFEQNVSHTIEDLDRILKFLRRTATYKPGAGDWPSLVKEDYTIDGQTVQISVIDAKGVMITSSLLLYPKAKIDLSDREHFRVHVQSDEDKLFISQPVLGRASGKWTIQFTRGITDAEGKFAGVLVVSLDPTLFARDYADLKFEQAGGFALIGDDGYVRLGTGVFGDFMARRIQPPDVVGPFNGGQLASLGQDPSGEDSLAVMREVKGFPLKVMVAIPSVESDDRLSWWRMVSFGAAALLSAIALLTTIAMAFRDVRFERKIVQLARRDPLTGLANRLVVGETLDRLFAAPAVERNYALHIIDLDRFKYVNDTYGHAVGDELLRDVAGRLDDLIEGTTSSRGWGATNSPSFSGRQFRATTRGAGPAHLSGAFQALRNRLDPRLVGASVGDRFRRERRDRDQRTVEGGGYGALLRKIEGAGHFASFTPICTRRFKAR